MGSSENAYSVKAILPLVKYKSTGMAGKSPKDLMKKQIYYIIFIYVLEIYKKKRFTLHFHYPKSIYLLQRKPFKLKVKMFSFRKRLLQGIYVALELL